MDRECFEEPLKLYLDGQKEGDFICFMDSRAQSRFIQFKVSAGRIYGEVGSCRWSADPEMELLGKPASTRLKLLGFHNGGPDRNYARDDLPRNSARLAEVAEEAWTAAYGDIAADALLIRGTGFKIANWAGEHGRLVKVIFPPFEPAPPLSRLEVGRYYDASPELRSRALRAMQAEPLCFQPRLCERLAEAVEGARTFDALTPLFQDLIRAGEVQPRSVIPGQWQPKTLVN